jgi:hypothetical protein
MPCADLSVTTPFQQHNILTSTNLTNQYGTWCFELRFRSRGSTVCLHLARYVEVCIAHIQITDIAVWQDQVRTQLLKLYFKADQKKHGILHALFHEKASQDNKEQPACTNHDRDLAIRNF